MIAEVLGIGVASTVGGTWGGVMVRRARFLREHPITPKAATVYYRNPSKLRVSWGSVWLEGKRWVVVEGDKGKRSAFDPAPQYIGNGWTRAGALRKARRKIRKAHRRRVRASMASDRAQRITIE